MTRIISWNLLHRTGATIGEVVRLAKQAHPDLLLMQEATEEMDALPARLGGTYARAPLPGRRHGLAVWSPHHLPAPSLHRLPNGAIIRRHFQVITLHGLTVANVHLSHGQVLNRRQLRIVAAHLPWHAAIIGDFNLVGPHLLPGFTESGPRVPTHRCAELVPLRLDRCLTRGLDCLDTGTLDRAGSDHHPIVVRLRVAGALAAAA